MKRATFSVLIFELKETIGLMWVLRLNVGTRRKEGEGTKLSIDRSLGRSTHIQEVVRLYVSTIQHGLRFGSVNFRERTQQAFKRG